MSIQQVAQAAVSVFPNVQIQTPRGTYSLPVVMVAIGRPEDGWGNGPGDPLSIYGDGGTSERAYSCGGYTSFGWPQINLPANHAMVANLSGIPASNPCGQAQWLADYGNAAKAAYAVYRSQGLGAWTTWNTGAYEAYLPQAQQAVAAVSGGSPSSGGTYLTQVRGQLSTGGIIALVAAVGAVAGGYYLLKRPRYR